MAAGLTNDISYESIVARTASYNRKLQIDKKHRLPFMDNATGIAQRPCLLQRKEADRYVNSLTSNVISYNPLRWKKTKKNFLAHGAVVRASEYANSSRAGLHASNGMSAQDALWKELDDEDSRSTFATGPIYDMDSEGSELADETYGGRRKKRKAKNARLSKPSAQYGPTVSSSRRRSAANVSYNTYTNGGVPYDEDPVEQSSAPQFACDVCGMRYRTKTRLNYHYNAQHAQQVKPSNASSAQQRTSISHTSASTGLLSALIENTPYEKANRSSTANGVNRNLPSTILESGTPKGRVSGADGEAGAEEQEEAWSCDFCLGDEMANKKRGGLPEALLRCSDCSRCAHFSCLQFTPNMVTSVRGYQWQCLECKTCWLCGTSENDEQMLFCDDCDRGYHMFCLTPPLSEPPEGSWSCRLCIDRYKGQAASASNPSHPSPSPPPPAKPQA